MYLEFFGHSASGKTTIKKILIQRYSYKHHGKKIVFNPVALIKTIKRVIKPCFILLKHGIFDLNLIFNIFVKYYFYNLYQGKKYVSDHGFIQTYLCSKKLIKKLQKNKKIIISLLLCLPRKNSKYVFFRIDKEKALKREEKRKKFKIHQKKILRYEEMDWLLKLFYLEINKLNLNVVTIDAGENQESIIKRII